MCHNSPRQIAAGVVKRTEYRSVLGVSNPTGRTAADPAAGRLNSVLKTNCMQPKTVSPLAPTIGLLAVAIVWGSTFFMLKDLVQQVPPLDFLGLRFGLAAIIVAATQFRRLSKAGARTWRHGLILGAMYSLGQWLQTTGLQYTDASVSGFISGMYVVFTPILLAVLFRKRLGKKVWVAAALATIGLAVLSLQGGLGGAALGVGELITLAAAVVYALHIVFLGRWAGESDPITLGLTQLVSAGVILGICALPGGVALPQTPMAWGAFLYMTIIAGLFAMVVQTWAQARISATSAAVIMAAEPVFSAAFAIAFGGEVLTPRLFIGGTLVLGAMLIIEGPGKRRRRRLQKTVLEHPPLERPDLDVVLQ